MRSMKMKRLKIISVSYFVACFTLYAQTAFAAFTEPAMAEYTCYPIFQVNAVEPNILIILDNSGSMNLQAYYGDYDHNTEYYGYFESYKKYSYASNLWSRNPSGAWDGNFLNWLCMRRVDVARKVLMGGLATSRTGGGNQTNIGETPDQSGRAFNKLYDDDDNVTPYSSGISKSYLVDGGYFYVDGNTYSIRVDKNMITYPDEAYNFVDGNIAGVLQKVGSRARWGNEFFNFGTGNNQSGGRVVSTIGTNLTSLVTDLQNTGCDTWTPLAESFYVAMQYFKQQNPQDNPDLDYANNCVPNSNLGDDPYYNGTEYVACADAFVILLTDGASTMDQMIPTMYKDYADSRTTNVFGTGGTYPDSGSDYLKDLALYARTTDLRSATVGKSELEGDQNMLLYAIYAFGNDDLARNLLKEAAKNGGFEDRNGNDAPDLQSEWDKDDDGVPDTYYEADNGRDLESKLIKAINDILERAASGTSVSVLATSDEGEGNLVQAYFRPRVTVGTEDIEWLGFLQSLWLDPHGYLREDTDKSPGIDPNLDVTTDKIVSFFLDPGSGNTKIKRYDVSAEEPYPDLDTATFEELDLEDITPVWEAGSLLAQRSADDRKIFTYIDKDNDGFPDSTTDGVRDSNPFNDAGEVVRFHTGFASTIKPYLGVRDNSTWDYLGATHDDRVSNLIQWVRGNDISGLRARTADWDEDGDDEVWKLGDIVHSTPVSLSSPPDKYHILYHDESYQNYYDQYKNRETVIYVGANDGMLHAFTSYRYDSATGAFTYVEGTEDIGGELWAYIPQGLLAHLKWLPDTDYGHVYYVDMKPKIFDAKILPDDTHYTDPDSDDNWGTFLLVGFNLGGGNISAKEDFDYNAGTTETTRPFYPSYVCMDVTEPRDPRLLWERTYQDLQKTSSSPSVVKVNDKWFAVFGSGPDDCDGTSSQNGYVYVVDLKTGDAYPNVSFAPGTKDGWLFEANETDAFMSSAVSFDFRMNYNVDAVYIGETWDDSPQGWKGKMYKISVPWLGVGENAEYGDTRDPGTEPFTDTNGNGTWNSGEPFTDMNHNSMWDHGEREGYYISNPKDATHPWLFSTLFDSPGPITAAATLSVDSLDNAWVYFGTGRYLSTADKIDTSTQYLFGIKDPFFNEEHQVTGSFEDDYYHNYSSSLTLGTLNLMNSDSYLIVAKNLVYDGTSSLIADDDGDGHTGEYDDLVARAWSKDGWMRTLTTSKERVVTKPAILGGALFTTSFVPNDDVCGFGGTSSLYGLYYETGTAYYKLIFHGVEATRTVVINGQNTEVYADKLYLGDGKSSSIGLHVGQEEGATGFLQQSTGTILREDLDLALKVRSGLRSWIEQ